MAGKRPTTQQPMTATTSKSNPSIPWSTRNKSETAKQAKPPASPSPSSSIILISPINKVLLLHRVQTSSSFPSAHVFPGGNLEASDGELATGDTNPARHKDNLAYRTGAIRELFEESGILLARENSNQDAPLLNLPLQTRLDGRMKIHSNQVTISKWLSQQSSSAVLDTHGLLPFTRWITPTNVPKRFTTQMYLYFLPIPPHDAPASDGSQSNLIATSDEVETMAPEWMYPFEWLDRARSGEIILFPPQFILLSFVSEFLDPSVYDSKITTSEQMSSDELEWRRRQLVRFVEQKPGPDVGGEPGWPAWRDKVISPTALSFTRADGRTVLGLDKAGPELKNHKDIKGDDTRVVLVKFSKEGPRQVEVMMRRQAFEEERRQKELKEMEEKEQRLREEKENARKEEQENDNKSDVEKDDVKSKL